MVIISDEYVLTMGDKMKDTAFDIPTEFLKLTENKTILYYILY